MVRTMWLIRWLAVIAAVCLVVGALLLLGLSQNVFVAQPTFPDGADLPTRLLGSIAARQASWPFDFASSLLFVVAFAALAILGRLLASVGPAGDGRSNVIGSSLFGGGLLVAASQLIHIGSQQVAIDVPYCDCGFKVQETISQYWGLTLIQGAESWLVNGGTVLVAIGVVTAGIVLAGALRSPAWQLVSWVTGLVAIVSVVLSGLELGGDLNQVLVAVTAGVLLPLWAILLAMRIGQATTMERDPVVEGEPAGSG